MLKFKVDEKTGCWIWKGKLDDDGYGNVKINQVTYKAHRISFMLLKGIIKNQHSYVCHTCDNPPCINPKHLFLGTARDNAQDRQNKGRTVLPDVKGENHPNSRLTENDIRNIRTSGLSNEKLSKIYKLKNKYVQQIKNHERWTNVK